MSELNGIEYFVDEATRLLLDAAKGGNKPDLSVTAVLWKQNDGTDWRVFFATNIDQYTRYLVEYVNGEHSITMVTDGPMPEE